MDLEYDLKFEEMKKYIPFLESMIKRLESTSSALENPRQAQLDKIRSLRDLLLDKKKRMKMENLLKCEQVLVNLYAKVEQRDALPGIKSVTDPAYQSNSKPKEDDLEVVRNKLKSVTSKRLDEEQDTLPEIARASITEELCTPGSKEPALFQRRPNKASLSPVRGTQKSPITGAVPTTSKRNYTRVLVSPEPATNNSRRWDSEKIIDEKPLFSRRSPRRSPKKESPTYHKKEKKKSKAKKGRDLNITLNVPEESLDSLNTTDILSRIMTCCDSDVDIETLREAKRQILNELQHTGANCDDISDLLLKSYKKKSNKIKRKDDVEEGELSDSESEAIESIYGGFMLDVDKNKSKGKDPENKEKPRKIQICLVINSDKNEQCKELKEDIAKPNEPDLSDFVMFDDKPFNTSSSSTAAAEAATSSKVNTSIGEKETTNTTNDKTVITSKTDNNQTPLDIKLDTAVVESKGESNASLGENGKPANFYKSIHEQTATAVAATEMKSSKQPKEACNVNSNLSGSKDDAENVSEIAAFLQGSSEINAKGQVEIPLLNDPSVARHKPKKDIVSEIDILQALKNEILGESLTVTDTVTPALHQPKLTKVSSVQEIVPKKRISIEKYKEKSVSVPKTVTPLFFQDPGHQSKDDHSKKQSLKLTMKECERFNFPTKLSLDEEVVSDEDNDAPTSLDDIYADLGPKSPDINDGHNNGNKAPVIIPADPIKGIVIPSKADVDMRAMHPKPPSSYAPALDGVSSESPALNSSMRKDGSKTNNDQNRSPFDPRMRRDFNQSSKIETSPHPHIMTPNRLQPVPPPMNYANMIPNMGSIMAPTLSSCISPLMTPNPAPNMTPTPNMTPSRNPNMTPNVRTYEINNMDEKSSKHVYAPFFPVYDQRENQEQSVAKETVQSPTWEINNVEKEIRKSRWESSWETPDNRDININRDPRSTSVQSETHEYHNSRFNDSYSGYKSSRYNIDRRDSFKRQDCPQTPIPSFGRSEVPIPQPYGRLDAPRTPVHPFGRSECPSTPNHPFSRGDCPPTPSHTFGRGDCPPTPSHSFGRGEMPVTPSHPFGRSDNYVRDPRLNRSSEYDNSQRDDRDRNYYRDRNSSHYKQDGKRSYTNSDSYRNFREQSVGTNDRNRYPSNEQSSRKYDKKEHIFGREASVGRERGHRKTGNDHRNDDENFSRGFQRERSVGRSEPSDDRSHRSSSRAPSVGRNFLSDNTDKKLSVKPHAGRSFTIDTSVNSTFQGFIDSDKKRPLVNSFDARRQRASSVGRTLCRESSMDRSLGRDSSIDRSFKPEHSFGRRLTDRNWLTDESSSPFMAKSKKNNFRRASSVGRDIIGVNAGKSFKDIKADFESYKLDYDMKYKKTYHVDDNRQIEKKKISRESSNNKSSTRIKPNKNDIKHTEHVGKKPYSPKKNNRDPRLRRELQDDKNKHKNYNYKGRDKKHVGIVYSNDNITKGTIMGSGYGVKNYKIPKIKRPIVEIEQDKVVIKTTDKNKAEKCNKDISMERSQSGDKNLKTSKPNSKMEPVVVKTDVQEDTEKRVTRSNRKSGDQSLLSDEDDYITKTRKSKKYFIYDTDSDTEAQEKEDNSAICEIKAKKTTGSKRNSKKATEKSENTTSKSGNVEAKAQVDPKVQIKTGVTKEIVDSKGSSSPQTLNENFNVDSDHSSFGIEDLEIFSDNIASDPVIDDNINALIADLDNDLEPSKAITPTEFNNEMTIENILGSMTGEAGDDKVMAEDLNDISEVIKKDLKETTDRIEMENSQKAIIQESHLKNTESVRNQVTVATNITKNQDGKVDEIEENQESVKDELNDTKKIESVANKENDKLIEIEKARNINEIGSKCPDETIEKLTDTVENSNDKNLIGSENIVSTTEIENNNLYTLADNKKEESAQLNRSSTPDSTNENVKSKQEESLPDSTNELQNETSSVVTSSRDSIDPTNKDNTEPNSSNKDVNPLLNNIENLFLFLQDKTKIKQVLSMLGDQSSENEKIKKKLEKLSEIVSDEEDTKEESEKLNTSEKNYKDLFEQVNDVSESKGTTLENEQNEALDVSSNIDVELFKNKELEQTAQCKEKKDTDSKSVAPVDNVVAADLKKTVKKRNTKVVKKIPAKKGRVGKKRKLVKKVANEPKRVTRSGAANLPSIDVIKIKKPNRELQKLQEDIKEMFISDDVLNATGIRMCRLAKLMDDKTTKLKDDCNSQDSSPMVVLEELKKSAPESNENSSEKVGKKKVSLKPDISKMAKPSPKYKPGPKSKTKAVHKSDDEDPYAFESDSVSENTIKSAEGKEHDSSDSEGESLASTKSYESAEAMIELKKKPKRKRSAWQAGIIKKNKKKKSDIKTTETPLNDDILVPVQTKSVTMPDMSCFTDKSYCFHKNVFTYSCRLCVYTGDEIVNHYKQQHPHSEIPLSRLSPDMAKEAIEQCGEINFQAISKIPTEKYVCRFCFKEFSKKSSVLEAFFWHIVSMHTGEYKQLCSLCVNITRCPFNLDIPPPPKDVKGQLIGYICEKCNFTQISLENLKTHVIVRHNDEQTEVYTINLAAMSKKTMNSLLKQCSAPIEKKPRVLRSSRSNQSMTEASDEHSDVTDSDAADEPLASRRKLIKDKCSPPKMKPPKINYQSKITFESDVKHDNKKKISESHKVKIEREDEETFENPEDSQIISTQNTKHTNSNEENITETNENKSDDIFAYPHFKIRYCNTGSKEYVCCINGKNVHYKTPLLISMKKHVQLKHISEIWDGYCFICKVIVTPQGNHQFKDCLQHYVDKHIDNFPVLENIYDETEKLLEAAVKQISPTKPYINVRPMSELISGESVSSDELPTLPKIESVVSLGAQTVESPEVSPSYPPALSKPPEAVKEFKYEEIQAEVMTKKHRVVLDTMMSHHKLLNVFKCAGRFCSFTTDSAEDALLHASTHQRVGGENSLMCAYCDFDCSGNAIDLVMHVFNSHNECPYVCGHCFYRAAASQLVAAHINRVHESMPKKVLASPNPFSPPTPAMLPRKDVVLYYECPHACKFRTYTAGKYCEHLLQRHSDKQWHSCYLCSQNHPSPTDLIMHLKSHELNLYQCPWCLHGADTEGTLLYHTSQKHPNKQPQAYLRVITNKDGSSEYRVLPLASFNKSKVAITTVTPTVNNENPAREAERSIELEKLIGHTNQMIESMATTSSAATNHPNTEIEAAVANIPEADPDPQEPIVTTVSASLPADTEPPRLETPPPVEKDTSEQVTPKIKLEPTDQTPTKNISSEVIYCLDSDDEDSRQSIIALSDDDSASSNVTQRKRKDGKKQIITRALLLKCGKCSLLFKNVGGFKRHLSSCYGSAQVLNCAHCEETFNGRDQLVNHYTEDHCEGTFNRCGVCFKSYNAMHLVKSHMKLIHKVSKYIISSKLEDGEFVYTVNVAPSATKRKLSSATSEPPAKMKRFGPQDIDQLPINPILDESVFCSLCEFQTKVRLNMVRHLQFHAEQQPVPETAPVNPVPHLESNEKHFDRMVNLASSSIVTRAPEKTTRPETTTTVSVQIPPEAASRYPKYVPDRQRLTCGAVDCSYISVDDDMLKYHWLTLHAGSHVFHCVHCPPYQHLDTSKPLTAARIIGHLKMHDSTLYACSECPHYHYKRLVVEKHLLEVHKGSGRVMVVREELASSSAPSTSQSSVSAPTMDLKPWQCGLCSFKSMLRPEVVEHCAKLHLSKMQYKCAYCPFRTSGIENVTKHQSNSHPGKKEEIFYYYYREGSISDGDDGTPRWMIQRQKMNPGPEVKSEVDELRNSSLAQLLVAPQKPVSSVPTPELDLNIVKKEVVDEIPDNASLEKLCSKYGQFCEPNGLKYKCPLCKNVVEDTKEAMQSHLYEELKYRKWACDICTYKAFHITGLKDHFTSEHRGKNPEPTLLPLDNNIENWVAGLLDHQTKSIVKNKENLAKQKILTEKPTPAPSASSEKNQEKTAQKARDKFSKDELEEAFGLLGEPINQSFVCPKCKFRSKDEVAMRDHLEGELTRIRWCCSGCTYNFQNYHEAQFHCKSVHTGLSARPKEAVRDPSMRSSWVSTVIQVQRLGMKGSDTSLEKELIDVPDSVDNSLLVVRYEERVPTTEEPVLWKRPAPNSGDERLVIEEPKETSVSAVHNCAYCNFTTKNTTILKEHTFIHFETKPFNCIICGFNGHKKTVMNHLMSQHNKNRSQKLSQFIEYATIPGGETPVQNAKRRKVVKDAKIEPKVVCLLCDKGLTEAEMETHSHEKSKPMFAKKGDVVVKCCICLALRIDLFSLQEHHNAAHPNEPINYAFYKMMHETRETLCCGHCNNCFRFIKDLRSHHEAAHPSLEVEYSTVPYTSGSSTSIPDSDEDSVEEKTNDPVPSMSKRVARKSTSKLPAQTVAKKSTTKLPFHVEPHSSHEFSYYGTKPEPLDNHRKVTTRMSLCNTMMPVSMKQLSELFKLNPSVVLEDCRRGRSSLQ